MQLPQKPTAKSTSYISSDVLQVAFAVALCDPQQGAKDGILGSDLTQPALEPGLECCSHPRGAVHEFSRSCIKMIIKMMRQTVMGDL